MRNDCGAEPFMLGLGGSAVAYGDLDLEGGMGAVSGA